MGHVKIGTNHDNQNLIDSQCPNDDNVSSDSKAAALSPGSELKFRNANYAATVLARRLAERERETVPMVSDIPIMDSGAAGTVCPKRWWLRPGHAR